MNKDKPILSLKKVSKFYYNKGLVASGFSKISLDFYLGEFVVITGESGCGKSTLLNVLSGLDTYEEGEMYINGMETSHYSNEEAEHYRKSYIGNIFQSFNLVSSYTVYQNIELVLLLNGFKKKDIKNKVIELIKEVDLYKYRNSKVSTPYEVKEKATGTITKDIVLGKNLFILGTMNTADKSIDAIDYAIRRRFIFIDSPADRNVVMKCYQNTSGNPDEKSIELLLFDAVQHIFDDSRFFNNEYQKSDVRIGHTYFLRDRKRGYEDAIIEHFVFQVVPILREYVKDGILDATENLVPLEHSPAEIFDAGSGEEQVTLLSENIMLYVKEFGNLTKSNATIDNEYVGKFIDELRKEFSY